MWGLISVIFMFVCLICSRMWNKTNKVYYAAGMLGALVVQFAILIIQVVALCI